MLHMRRGASLISDILEDRGWVNEKLEEEVLKIESVIFLGKIDVLEWSSVWKSVNDPN